nr:serine hydrolase domain-containing protein [Kribbella pittospori]
MTVQASTTRATRPDLQAGVDAIVAAGAPGALVEVRDERGTWRTSSGVAALGTTKQVPVGGRFRAGSVTKIFVATVVLQLAAEGRLRLDDTVERWLPGAVPAGGRITLRQLLNHTSGLYNYTDDLPLHDTEAYLQIRFQTWSPSELLKLATRHPLLFEPGTQWRYSNTDDIVLGLVVQRVSGHPYGVEIERRILRPVGLHATSIPGTSARIPGPHAHGYLPLVSDGQVSPIDVTEINPSAAWAAGEMISTTADLNRFLSALIGGRLVSPVELREMTTPTLPATDYGLGLKLVHLPCGVTVYGHDGDAPGYSTWSYATADTRRRITISITWGTGDPHGPLPQVLDLLATAVCPRATA